MSDNNVIKFPDRRPPKPSFISAPGSAEMSNLQMEVALISKELQLLKQDNNMLHYNVNSLAEEVFRLRDLIKTLLQQLKKERAKK
jgi:hypothetical protein